MPEGNDFVGGLGVLFVVDAVADLWGSFECLPAGLSRPRRKKRRIILGAPCARHALRDGNIWMLTLGWLLDLQESPHKG